MMNTVISNQPKSNIYEDPIFDEFVLNMNTNIKSIINRVKSKDYTPILCKIRTKSYNDYNCSNGLWDIFIDNIDEDIRQHYRCNACKKFIDNYGDLVIIDKNNNIISLLWNESITPDIFKRSVKLMRESCENGKLVLRASWVNSSIPTITNKSETTNSTIGMARSDDKIYEEYNHLHIMEGSLCGTNLSLNFNDYTSSINTLMRFALGANMEHIDRFVSIVNSDNLYGIERYRWVTTIKEFVEEFKLNKADLIVLCIKYSCLAEWQWAHFNSSVIGTIYDMVTEDKSDDSIEDMYEYITDPRMYQMPDSTPSDELIKKANMIFKEYNITTDSLRRRPARLDELNYIWVDYYKEESPYELHGQDNSGVFDSLLNSNKQKPYKYITKHHMSMNKFLNKILPECDKVSILINNTSYGVIYNAGVWFNTATCFEAEPILIHDLPDSRQPVSQYQIDNPIHPKQYLDESYINNKCIDIYGICYDAKYWNSFINPETISDAGINFIVKKGKTLPLDKLNTSLFPAILQPRFHSIRKVIWQYSKNSSLDPIDPENATPAVGIRFYHGFNASDLVLRVHNKYMGWMDITITVYETE